MLRYKTRYNGGMSPRLTMVAGTQSFPVGSRCGKTEKMFGEKLKQARFLTLVAIGATHSFQSWYANSHLAAVCQSLPCSLLPATPGIKTSRQ
mmetsp:Transcript_24461/g.56987  ORF Transcript_24461/g.56987 Transcript_24461/m.56987 type:complete len:92 (+) Transcript_24461:1826-2101(+)